MSYSFSFSQFFVAWLLVVCTMSFPAAAQSSSFEKSYTIVPEPAWFLSQNIVYAEPLPEGGYYGVGGFNAAPNFGEIGYINFWKISGSGDTLWTRRVGTLNAVGDSTSWGPLDAVLTTEGAMYVLYRKYIPGTNYNGILKVNNNGEVEWNTPISPQTQWANGYYERVVLSPDGGCVVAGATTAFPSIPSVIKLNAQGSVQWESAIFPNDYGYNKFHDLCLSSDGGYFATGIVHHNLNGRTSMLVSKINANGGEMWSKVFNSGFHTEGDLMKSEGFAVEADNAGGCIATGYQTEAGNWNRGAYLVGLDAVGNVLWEKQYLKEIANGAVGYNLLKTNDNYYLLYASTHSGYTDDNPHLIKMNVQGDTLWSQTGYYRYFGWNTFPRSVDNQNRVLFSGAASPDANQAILIRTTPSGVFRAPNLFLPWNEQINVGLETHLVLQGPYIHKYRKFRYQVATDANFDAIVIDNNAVYNDSLYISGLQGNTAYYWRVQGFGADENGSPWSQVFHFTTGNFTEVPSVAEISDAHVQVFPNPVYQTAAFEYYLPNSGTVHIALYDMNGHLVAVPLLQHRKEGGKHYTIFDVAALPVGAYQAVLYIDDTAVAQTSLLRR